MKLCRDCRFMEPDEPGPLWRWLVDRNFKYRFGKCWHPSAHFRDYETVTGESNDSFYCSIMHKFDDLCGHTGKHWKPAPKAAKRWWEFWK